MCASGDHASIACAPSDLRLAADVLDGLGLLLEPQLYRPTALGGRPGGPGPFDQGASGVGVTGCGDRTRPAALTTGRVGGDQAQICHQLPGVLEAREVSALRHDGHSHGAWHAPPGLKGRDYRVQAPGCDLFLSCLHQALEPCGVLMDRAHVFLEDDVLRRGGADPFGAPPERGRALDRATRRADIRAEPNGFETKRGGLEIGAGVFPSPAAVTDGFVFHRRNIDGGRSPARLKRASWMASRRAVFMRSPACWGISEGATTQP
jgi:hypothetical protein